MARTWDITGVRTVGGVETLVTIATVHELEYHDEWMGDEYLTVTVKSPKPIDFHIDDFITYRGDIYALGYDPNVVKKARRNTYGEGFVYDGIRLTGIAGKLSGYAFKDYVLEDNGLAYSSLDTFSFFAKSVEDLADRIQANIDRQDPFGTTLLMQMYGDFKVLTPNWARCSQRGIEQEEWEEFYNDPSVYGRWGYSDEAVTLGETDVDIQVDGTSCTEALKMSYTKFGLSWFTKGGAGVTYIVIGGPAVVADKGSRMIFRYGRNLGLYEIERTSPDDQELVTRMFAYGSDKNLPLNYYANLTKKAFVTGTRDREYHSSTEDYSYGIRTNIPYSSVKGALTSASTVCLLRFTDGGGIEHTAYANANSSNNGVDGGTQYLYMSLHPTSGADEAFYNAIGTDSEVNIYVSEGVDVNRWPQAYIETSDPNYPALLSVGRLMLPGFPLKSLKDWVEDNHPELLAMYDFSEDKYDPWVMSKNAQYAGIIEGTANFDGSQQKEIYPSIEGTGYNTVGWGSLENLGNVSGNVKAVTDNGFIEDGGSFTICMDKSGGLDWKRLFDSRGEEDMVIGMTSGHCTGMDFKVLKVEEGWYQYGLSTIACWVLTCERKQDGGGRWFPYNYADGYGISHVLHGDTFVVSGIPMPDEYIKAASERLLISACGWLDRRDHVRYTYLPKVDNIYMARQDEAVQDGRDAAVYGTVSLHDTLRAGMRMEFEDAADLGIERYGDAAPYIDVLTIREDGGDGIPSYDVVLRDEKERGTLEMLTDSISQLKGATQVVERTSRPSMNVDYEEWIAGTPYYYQTLNPDPNPDISSSPYIETSYVWHRGKKWMCLRTLTQEEPMMGAQDWKVVEGSTDLSIEFVSTRGYSFRRGSVNTQILSHLFWGTEDITSQVAAEFWNWTRESESGKTAADETWDAQHRGVKNITLTDQDMPSTWSFQDKAIFTLTVTVAQATVQNQIIS